MCVNQIPIKYRMKDHFSCSAMIMCRVLCIAYDVCKCLQCNISLIHNSKINAFPENNIFRNREVIHTGKNTVITALKWIRKTAERHSFWKIRAFSRPGLKKKIPGIDAVDGMILLLNYCVFRFPTNKKVFNEKERSISRSF